MLTLLKQTNRYAYTVRIIKKNRPKHMSLEIKVLDRSQKYGEAIKPMGSQRHFNNIICMYKQTIKKLVQI